MRHFSAIDQKLVKLDRHLRKLLTPAVQRPNPAEQASDLVLSKSEAIEAARLMRVNHTGEICAQALYQAQAISARSDNIRTHMQIAAQEETDHLNWCKQRLQELGSHTSYLNPLWYAGSFSIGLLAGAAGDRWSLGFVAETENQVTAHLNKHLQRLPKIDHKSRAILEQMRADEMQHADTADQAGAAKLPWIIRQTMRLSAKVMTTTAYWV